MSIRGLLTRIRTEEQRRVRDTATLNFQLTKIKKKNQKLENEAKLERDKRHFKENELVNCRLALDRAYDTIDTLEKKISACKESHVHVHELDKAEERHAILQAKLLEKDNQLLERTRQLQDAKKTNESLRREASVMKAKYDMMMKSEHALALEVRDLHSDLKSLKHASDRRNELVGSLNSGEREEAIKTLLKLGKKLPGSFARMERDRYGYGYVGYRDRDEELDDSSSECSSLSGAVSL